MAGEEMESQRWWAGADGSLPAQDMFALSFLRGAEITSVLLPRRHNLSHHERSISLSAFEASYRGRSTSLIPWMVSKVFP